MSPVLVANTFYCATKIRDTPEPGNPAQARVSRNLGLARHHQTTHKILDEATEGLAPLIAQDIWNIVKAIRATGIATIIVDKNFGALSAITDRNILLVKGKIVFDGTTGDLVAQPELLQRSLGI